jgi:hypothetical protein
MADTKYVIFKELEGQYGAIYNVPIIFPDVLTHVDLADSHGGKENVLSAGFLSVGQDENGNPSYRTYGESISLGVKSRPEDKRLVTRVFERMW